MLGPKGTLSAMSLMRLTVALSLVLCLGVSGCASKSDVNPESSSQNVNVKSGWDCQSQQDGLGENFGCASTQEDSDGVYWSLNVLCTSDLISKHSIVGIDFNGNPIMWPEGEKTFMKARIDSKPIEEWRVSTKTRGQGLVFVTNGNSNFDVDSAETRETWKFLSTIAGAKTFGFKATDVDGYVHSVLFNVENSIPIAAKFGVLGCKSN